MLYQIAESLLTKFAAVGDSCDPTKDSNSFFGLKPWYEYLGGETDSLGQCTPLINDGTGIWLIVLAIIDSLLRIAAFVAVAMVIYGGVQYTISQGEPEKTNQAKTTIINALVGMSIAIAAASIVAFIGNRIK